jgi:glucose/arabinose dehydrogenase/outer membrane protein assembly factor BamB
MRLAPLVALAALLAVACASAAPERAAVRAGGDWTRFGYDAARRNAGPSSTGITAANVGSLRRQRVALPGTADSSPVYLRGARVRGKAHDVFILTTSYGRAVAVDADSGAILWRFTPRGYSSWAGSYRITHSSPVVDPSRRFVYSAAPDGRIHKLLVASGREVRSGRWPATITRLPAREKLGTALNFSRGLVLATTGGFIGDAPPYQGHVVAINARTGRLVHVWNALCSDRRALIRPSSCSESGAAIWARSGVVVLPGSGRLLVATGDGKWDGRRHWGDSVLMLSRDAGRLLQNWTPTDAARLEREDVDLGSTAPALVSSGLIAQSGKDARLRLLRLARLNGTSRAGARQGGELQTLLLGEGLFSAPAVWRSGGRTWVFTGTAGSTRAFVLTGGRLQQVWRRGTGGTSPVVAGGLLYVYDPNGGGLNVRRPTDGSLVATLPAGSGHWSSPIVTDGRIALPEGDANEQKATGILNIYRVGASRAPARTRALRLVRVASGLDEPTYVAAAPGERGRLYVVEKTGRIVVLQNGRVRKTPFLDLRGRVSTGSEQGLLSVAFHPRYARNHRLFVNYTDRAGDTRVVEYRSNGTRALPGTARQILFVDQPYANHNGGQLQFGPDGALYVGMGDGGSGGDPQNRAQNPSSLFGKLLRIRVDRPGRPVTIAALGLRNPWRFSFDRRTKDLWIADVGQNEWEEVDFLPRRRLGETINYGWRVWEGRERFEDREQPTRGSVVFPVAVYNHDQGCSVTGGYVYRGGAVPAARGRYFYGDYCSGRVWSLRGSSVRREPFTVDSLSSFGEGSAGELYLASLEGAIYRLAD